MPPDLILINADIRTMDAAHPRAEAIAVRDGRILALGSDAQISALAGPETQIINAGGRLVLPGFQDAHVHLLDGGTDLIATAALWDAQGVPDLHTALRGHAVRWTGPMVTGAGWQPGVFGDHNLTAAVLDAAVPDRPCIVYDSSYHQACLNSAAMRMAGLTQDTPDPAQGHFVRDAHGEPTGMLHEAAIQWALPRLPQTPDQVWRDGLRAGQAHANRHGITGVLDPAVRDYHARAYGDLAASGALTLWVSGAATVLPEEHAPDALARLTALRAAHPGPEFHIHSAKFFLDGVFENRTAALIAPYADAPAGNAGLMFSPGQIAAHFAALDGARFQIHVHVIGDLAARAALDGFAAARAANGYWPALHQLAHLQLVDQADIPRLEQLEVMANIQPLWAQWDPHIPDIAMDMIGPLRAAQTYAFGQMRAAGVRMCLSSDWAVSTLNPFEIIETAVTRQARAHESPKEPFFPAECLTVDEAVKGYTLEAAAACWRSGFTGQLSPGYSADLIVLDRDIFACKAQDIGDTQVLLTLFRGTQVHRHPTFDA